MFENGRFERVVHLAAQAGVRYSVEHTHVYAEANLAGFLNVLEGCRHTGMGHLVYASSSSVYGANQETPFACAHGADHPVSLYTATKRANELMAHSYSSLYGLPVTGLRFFTMYGPWGRPDMALFKFVRAILNGERIDIYSEGKLWRDFAYIDDIVEGVVRVMDLLPEPDPLGAGASPVAPYAVYDIGSGRPVEFLDFGDADKDAVGAEAERRLFPMQPGDVYTTYVDIADQERAVDFRPQTSLREGGRRFVEWYRAYYGVPERPTGIATPDA